MVYLQVRLIESNINIHKMKRETKTVVEYTAPRCKELAAQAMGLLCSSPYGDAGYPGSDVDVDDDDNDY